MTEQEMRQEQQARFEKLAHLVAEPLHRYLLRRTNPDMVEDILSETMLVLWRRIDDVLGLGTGSMPDPGAGEPERLTFLRGFHYIVAADKDGVVPQCGANMASDETASKFRQAYGK